MSQLSTVALLLGSLWVAATLRTLALRWWYRNPSRLPYPPGPKGYPIINNLLDVPAAPSPWEGWAALSKTYGDIVFLRVLNQPMMVLSSVERTSDLFDKRAAMYSGRPRSIMMGELMGFYHFFAMIDYGSWWRKHRRAFHQHFYPAVVPKYHSTIKFYTQRLLVALYENKDLDESARNSISGTGIKIVYGVDVKTVEDPFIKDALEVADAFKVAAVPGKFLVENIPLLKYIPSWMPGAGFKRWADHYSRVAMRLIEEPFRHVHEAHEESKATPCMATSLIDRFPENDGEQREEARSIARNVCSQSHMAAVDTTHGTAMAFYLAMAMNPDIQKKAHEELDRVCGPGNIPDFSQRDDLPYIGALIQEVFRWHQVIPMALPHLVREDHIYDGYFIPKGTIVFGNAWAILHDPEVFEDPMTFNPERYLRDGKINPDVLDPLVGTFGFGRRICPGRYLAIDIIYSVVTSTLTLFNVNPPKDESGNPIKLEARFTGGAIMRPEKFDCVFEPRSSLAKSVLQDLKANAESS